MGPHLRMSSRARTYLPRLTTRYHSTATTFLPQLLARFEFSAVKTNLYTVAPNLVAVCYLFTIAFLSDYTRQRTLFLMLALATTMTGCIILASVPVTAIGVGYFACFLIQCGSHVPTVIFQYVWAYSAFALY